MAVKGEEARQLFNSALQHARQVECLGLAAVPSLLQTPEVTKAVMAANTPQEVSRQLADNENNLNGLRARTAQVIAVLAPRFLDATFAWGIAPSDMLKQAKYINNTAMESGVDVRLLHNATPARRANYTRVLPIEADRMPYILREVIAQGEPVSAELYAPHDLLYDRFNSVINTFLAQTQPESLQALGALAGSAEQHLAPRI